MPANKRITALLVTGFLLAALPAVASENDWPSWRGDANTGTSATANPPIEWSYWQR